MDFSAEIFDKKGSLSVIGNRDKEPLPLDTVANFVCDQHEVYPHSDGVEPTTTIHVKCNKDPLNGNLGLWLTSPGGLPVESCISGKFFISRL